LKQLFDISFPDKEIIQPVLALQLGNEHCAFAISDYTTGQLSKLAYHSDDVMDGSAVEKIFNAHPVLSQGFFQVKIGYQFHEAAIVPATQFQHEHQSLLLKTLYGAHSSMNVIAESTIAAKLNTVYVVPIKIYQQLNGKFSGARYWHHYSIALKSTEDNTIRLDFRQSDFSAVVYKNSRMLFAGNFDYSTPSDVLYFLLKIAHSYQLSQQDSSIQVTGLIDTDSALYQELLQYFLHVECRGSSWQTGYPSHYFTSLNELSKCE